MAWIRHGVAVLLAESHSPAFWPTPWQVRFFERVKIERAIAKLERKTKTQDDGAPGVELTQEEQTSLQQLKADLQVGLCGCGRQGVVGRKLKPG